MARIAGVDLPRNKRVEIALTYIYGIGKHRAQVIIDKAQVDPNKRTDVLDENDDVQNVYANDNTPEEILAG